jgi:very-short-patch-repair endonuclease
MCKNLYLIIEVDGASHDHSKITEKDNERQKKLEAAGYTVLRFTDKDVLENMDAVCRRIDEEIALLEVD